MKNVFTFTCILASLMVAMSYAQTKGKFNFSKNGLMVKDTIRSSESIELKSGTIKFDVPQLKSSDSIVVMDGKGRIGYKVDSSQSKKDRIEVGFAAIATGSLIKSIYTDSEAVAMTTSSSNSKIILFLPNKNIQVRDITLDYTFSGSTVNFSGVVIKGQYLYVACVDVGANSLIVLRYQKRGLSLGAVLMTSSGLSLGSVSAVPYVGSDGQYMYISCAGNTNTNPNIIAKYLISGTQLVYQSSTTFNVPNQFQCLFIDKTGSIFFYRNSGNVFYKCSSSGVLLVTYEPYYDFISFMNWDGDMYIGMDAKCRCYQKLFLE